jgi:hypothetical protein
MSPPFFFFSIFSGGACCRLLLVQAAEFEGRRSELDGLRSRIRAKAQGQGLEKAAPYEKPLPKELKDPNALPEQTCKNNPPTQTHASRQQKRPARKGCLKAALGITTPPHAYASSGPAPLYVAVLTLVLFFS